MVFDTDLGNDVDDVMALAVLHALQSRGECRILAVTLTNPDPWAGPFVDAINTFYGRGDIPIGLRKEGKPEEESRFLKLVQDRQDDKPVFPRDLDPAAAPEAVELLRKTLADQPDQSVVLVQVGFSSNLVRLLESPADQDLVRRKVRRLVVMAGAFQAIDGEARYKEFNVVKDVASARKLAEEWPTPVVWSGFEIGKALPYPAASIERDFAYVPRHPVAEASRLYDPPPAERPTWDLTAAIAAVRPDHGYFQLSPPGQVVVEDDGFTRFTEQADGRHRLLVLDPAVAPRTREALVMLVTQPPLP